MKKVTIIGSLEAGTKNNPEVILTHLRQQGVDVELWYWEKLVFKIERNLVTISCEGRELARDVQPELVIAIGWYKSGKRAFYRDVAYATALYLQHAGIPFWNSEMAQQRSTTKLSCLVQLALSDIPVPLTHFSLDSKLMTIPEGPSVIKAISASRGRSNFLVKTAQEAARVLDIQPNLYTLQPFLPNDHDLRVICFGGEPLLVLRRSRVAGSTSHMNNTSQGGDAKWLEMSSVDERLLTASREICKIMKREMGGIDFIPDSSSPFGYSCLEVNAIPQLTSGHDTDKKLNILAASILRN
jgi:glutathione synthase/RimK-type ligase-like ATP-grasp enzyme